MKKRVKKRYNWKRRKGEKEEYVKKRKKFRKRCKKKEENYREGMVKEVRNLKTETQTWGWLNKKKKTARDVNKNIKIESWEKHYSQLLKESKEKCKEGVERKRVEGDSETEITDK